MSSEAMFRRLAELGVRRRELEEQMLKQREQLDEVDRLLHEAAAMLLAGSGASAPVVLEDDFSDIQPRQMELLRLLKRDPAATQGDLATAMYKRNDEITRRSISAYFSRLRSAGYVDAVEGERGQYKLTSRGEAAAARARQ